MTKKHKDVILSRISDTTLKSTRDLQREVSKITGKSINWESLFRTLSGLADKGLVKMYETKGGFFWIGVGN